MENSTLSNVDLPLEKLPTHETVCLLSKLHEAKHHVSVKLDMDEMDLTSAESKATYEEIKKYVAEHNDGMKVSNEKTLVDEVEDYRNFGGYLPIANARLLISF